MREFLRAYPPAVPAIGPAYWLPFSQDQLIVEVNGTDKNGKPQLNLIKGEPEELQNLLQPLTPPLLLGTLDGLPCLTCRVSPEMALPPHLQIRGLRSLYGKLDETAYTLAGYAFQLVEWQRTSRYCPVCASLTEPMAGDWGRKCSNPACGYLRYPPLSPAVLVLIHDGGNNILLTHKQGWGEMYSLIAGFVEPGETLEGCVRREVLEEVGLVVEEIDTTYAGSQPWPFPHQLMLGFMVRYQGEATDAAIRLDAHELDAAKWFSAKAMPSLPAPLSLSRQLIDEWLETTSR